MLHGWDRKLVLALGLVLAPLGLGRGRSLEGEEAPLRPPQDDAARQRLRKADQKALASFRRDLERPGARFFDVRVQAERLGRDPRKMIEFVQKEIRFDPYPGLQRGPAGTLVARAGNALDKAFLLVELLRAGGLDARMTRAALAREKAQELVQASLGSLRSRPPGGLSGPFGRGETKNEGLEKICEEIGLKSEEVLPHLEVLEKGLRDSWTRILELTDRERSFLSAKIDQARLPAPEEPLLEELVGSALAHARVQWKSKDAAAWSDADPCFSDAASLKAVSPSDPEADPRGIADRFELTLALERTIGPKRETVEVLKFQVPVFETLLEPPQFTIQPTDPQMPAPGEKMTSEELLKRLTGYREFVAAVLSGRQARAVMVFDLEGTVSKPKLVAGKIAGGAAGAVAQVADLFGNKPASEKGTLTSLFVDFSTSREGKLLWKQRRTILDPAQKSAWCPLLDWNLFFHTHPLSRAFISYMHRATRVENAAREEALADWAQAGARGDLMKALATKGSNYPLDLLDFSLAREAYAESLMGGRGELYFNRPNLFLGGRTIRFHLAPQRICACYGIDLVENGAIPLDPGLPKLHRETTRALGVFDTVLEQALVGSSNGSEPVAGTLPFFEKARLEKKPILLVPARDSEALAKAGVPPADVEWIRANAEEGSYVLVVALESAPGEGTFAWWSYDPRTGRTVGRVTGGRGGARVGLPRAQELSEYAELIETGSTVLCGILFVVNIVHGKAEEAAKGALECAVVSGGAGMLATGTGWTIELLHCMKDIFEIKHGMGGHE